MVTRRRSSTVPERTVNVALILVTFVKRAFADTLTVNVVEPALRVRLTDATVFGVRSLRAVAASTVSVAVTGHATAHRAVTRTERLPDDASVNRGFATAGVGDGVIAGVGTAVGTGVALAVGVAVAVAVALQPAWL